MGFWDPLESETQWGSCASLGAWVETQIFFIIALLPLRLVLKTQCKVLTLRLFGGESRAAKGPGCCIAFCSPRIFALYPWCTPPGGGTSRKPAWAVGMEP